MVPRAFLRRYQLRNCTMVFSCYALHGQPKSPRAAALGAPRLGCVALGLYALIPNYDVHPF